LAEPPIEYLPDSHAAQVLPSCEKRPGLHTLQFPRPVSEYLPAWQVSQLAEPPIEYLPDSHATTKLKALGHCHLRKLRQPARSVLSEGGQRHLGPVVHAGDRD